MLVMIIVVSLMSMISSVYNKWTYLMSIVVQLTINVEFGRDMCSILTNEGEKLRMEASN